MSLKKEPRITLYDYAYESFSIQYLCAVLKSKGFRTEVYYDCSMNKDYLGEDFFLTTFFSLSAEKVAREIVKSEPDVVGFSILTVYYPLISQIIRRLKELRPDLIILAGGPHCTLTPHSTLENRDIDFVFQGDADIALPKLISLLSSMPIDVIKTLSVLELQGISNVTDNGEILDRGLGPVVEDLDSIPFPEKDIYYKKNPSLKMMYTITCSRGCIFTCSYCNSYSLRKVYRESGKRYYRLRSVENVLQELRMAVKKYNPRYIMFLDNLFAPKPSWLKQFTRVYKEEIGLPFFCETNPNVHTIESIDALADAGCAHLQFGFQSVNEEVRREILGRRETNQHIKQLIARAKQRNVLVCVDHIADLPSETKEHLDEALEFYREVRPYWVNLGFLQYYPKAEIIDIAAAHRILSQKDIDAIHAGHRQTSFRLLSKTSLDSYYKTLPIRLFLAFKMPDMFSRVFDPILIRPLPASIFSYLASWFIYATRILSAFTNRRDFLVRHHVIRNFYVMKAILKEKFITNGR